MRQAVINAKFRATETTQKLAIVNHYKNKHAISLSYKCVERMDAFHLDLAYRMLRLEQVMYQAATRIACIYRGIKTRRKLKAILKARKSATLFIQAIIKRRILKMRKLAL